MPPKKEVLRDPDGNRITKSGRVDKRSVSSKENLQKSPIYQNIIKAKEALSKQPVVAEDDESDDESEDEYEIEEIKKVKKAPDTGFEHVDGKPEPVVEPPKPVEQPKPVEPIKFVSTPNDIEERTKKWLAEQNEMKKRHDEEVLRLKEENKKLKGLHNYNDHLNRISHLAKNVSIKF